MSEKQLNHQNRLLLYGTVTISGAAVMMLELLGTRIIGPVYRVSLYVSTTLRGDAAPGVFGLRSESLSKVPVSPLTPSALAPFGHAGKPDMSSVPNWPE